MTTQAAATSVVDKSMEGMKCLILTASKNVFWERVGRYSEAIQANIEGEPNSVHLWRGFC